MLSSIITPHISSLTVVGIATLIGYYAGHGARLLKLPSIIGYMIVGVILGPSIFGLFSEAAMEDMSFITEIALGFVAFSIGSELSMASLKKLGPGIISIIFSESFTALFFNESELGGKEIIAPSIFDQASSAFSIYGLEKSAALISGRETIS